MITSNNPDVVTVGNLSEFTEHPVFEDTLIGRFVIDGAAIGATRIAVKTPDNTLSSACDVLVVEPSSKVVLPPTELEFANSSMSVTVNKTRTVLLRAPIELASGAMTVSVTIDGNTCALLDDTLEMVLTSDGWLEGRVRVSGIEVGDACTLTATWQKQVATGSLRATKPVGLFGDDLDFVVLDQQQGPTLGIVRSTGSGHLIEIFGQHVSLAPILGNRTRNGYANEEAPQAKLAVFNAISTIIADWIVRKDAERAPYDYPDADAVLQQRAKTYARYAGRLVHLVEGEPG